MAKSRICSIPGCGKKHYGKGYCKPHYLRWWRHGDPKGILPPKGAALRFLKRVVSSSEADCINWPFSQWNGYGQIRYKGRTQIVSRLVCRLAHGEPSPEMDAAHSCGNALCCNPNHLRWATRLENVDDTRKHGTFMRGEKQGQAKLTEADIPIIRVRAKAEMLKDIAKDYNVHPHTISHVVHRRTWAWLA